MNASQSSTSGRSSTRQVVDLAGRTSAQTPGLALASDHPEADRHDHHGRRRRDRQRRALQLLHAGLRRAADDRRHDRTRREADSGPKDTWSNIAAHRRVRRERHRRRMADHIEAWPANTQRRLGDGHHRLGTVDSQVVAVPSLVTARRHLECRVLEVIDRGDRTTLLAGCTSCSPRSCRSSSTRAILLETGSDRPHPGRPGRPDGISLSSSGRGERAFSAGSHRLRGPREVRAAAESLNALPRPCRAEQFPGGNHATNASSHSVAGACAAALVLAGCADRRRTPGARHRIERTCHGRGEPDVNDDGKVLIGVSARATSNDNGYYEGFVTGARSVVDAKGWELIKVGLGQPRQRRGTGTQPLPAGSRHGRAGRSEMRDAIPAAEEAVCANTVWYSPSSTDLEPTPYVTSPVTSSTSPCSPPGTPTES